MISEERALQLIQESINSLTRVRLIEQDVNVRGDTVLLGVGTPLDSIAFVTFMTDMEDRLSQETSQEIFLVLNDIHEFNYQNAYLSVGILARYIVGLSDHRE